MDRRTFIAHAGGLAAAALITPDAVAQASTPVATTAAPATAAWRRFEVVTDIEMRPDAGATRLWLPIANADDTDYYRSTGITWSGNAAETGIYRDPVYGAPAFFARWDGTSLSELTVKNTFMARNRRVDLARPRRPAPADDDLALYLASTPHIPTEGIVRETARGIVRGHRTDPLTQARAIYEWIVENTYRDPKVAGCGTGDIVDMLESRRLGGKCADLNALFVGLARASGIPARDVYGVRVASSGTWKSLGRAGDISKAQHCRAEFWDARFGWIPVDPADVRKVVLEEDASRILPLTDPRVVLARRALFGSWEMNWMPFNTAGDTSLAPPTSKPIGHFMYPHAETSRGVLDPYDPDGFRYRMTARETPA